LSHGAIYPGGEKLNSLPRGLANAMQGFNNQLGLI
jgi:hypothetical protein